MANMRHAALHIIEYKHWIFLGFGKSLKSAAHFAGSKGMMEALLEHMKQSNSKLVPNPLGDDKRELFTGPRTF